MKFVCEVTLLVMIKVHPNNLCHNYFVVSLVLSSVTVDGVPQNDIKIIVVI